jgi:hypothetical protein
MHSTPDGGVAGLEMHVCSCRWRKRFRIGLRLALGVICYF